MYELSSFATLIIVCCVVQQLQALPENISPVTSTESGTCGSFQSNSRRDEINVLISDRVNPALNDLYGPPCNCGSEWTKLGDLDMSNTSQACPSNWQLVTTNSFRGCRKLNLAHASQHTSSHEAIILKSVEESLASKRDHQMYFRNH